MAGIFILAPKLRQHLDNVYLSVMHGLVLNQLLYPVLTLVIDIRASDQLEWSPELKIINLHPSLFYVHYGL